MRGLSQPARPTQPKPVRPAESDLGERGGEVEAGQVVALCQAVQVVVVDGRACGAGSRRIAAAGTSLC